MKRLFFFMVVFTSVFIIHNLVTSIYNLWQKHDLLVQKEKELEDKRKENETLKKKLEYVKSTTFIEKEARDKLFLGKPEEKKVVIDTNVLKLLEQKKNTGSKEDKRSNIQQWWELFF